MKLRMPKELPTLVLFDDIVLPHVDKNLLLEKTYNIRACERVLNRSAESKQPPLILATGMRENKTTLEISETTALDVGVLCEILQCSELASNQGIRRCSVMLRGIKRVRLKNLHLDADNKQVDKCWLAEFKYMKSVHSKKLMDLVYDDVTIEVTADPTESEEVEEAEGDNLNLEILVDRIADSWPKTKPGALEAKRKILVEPNVMDRLCSVLSFGTGMLGRKSTTVTPQPPKSFTGSKLYDEPIAATMSEKEEIDEHISKKVSKNISRQQKEFYLREKLKVIKEELGDASSKEVEVRKLRDMINKGKYPPHVVKKARDELQRFEMCSSYSNEATVIRSYLDWLLSLPWMYSSKDEMDLNKVQKILDSNHYGLDKIKERIIEFLAVKKKSSKDAGTIICFVGPPGVGKTSLAQSIAEALEKQFVKISLGGLYDESELRGHRRTYVASMPGKIIRALRQAKVKNPVMLLDEIDKMSAGYHGDPVHALLEILDPKQNENFSDHYIEEDFDLSKVMFIATANYDENIPDPLLDRMEMIYLRSYTETEKLNIAKQHLIPSVLDDSGLTADELKFSDEAITFIIQRYTREAGVRSLKKQIEKITRKVVKGMVVDGKEVHNIGVDEVKQYLESELFDITKKDDENMPGVVNGMAYTDFGGDLLPIEVNHVSGKGNLSLTGNLRDTMKESASVALAYVRANEDQFGLKDKAVDWNNIDVNLHVPTGGTPKDGPSAGVTIATALISSFSGKPVSSKVAMTGEITLRGKVLPIGGLREKVVSAVRGGVDTIFYPEENAKNLKDIPEEIKNKIKLIPVKHFSEIYNNLF